MKSLKGLEFPSNSLYGVWLAIGKTSLLSFRVTFGR